MRHITAAEIEVLAREMLRETIERSGSYPAPRARAREDRIDRDVDKIRLH